MNSKIDYSDLASVSEVAEMYRRDRKTIYNWLRDGVAPLGVTICGRHYFFKSALKDFHPPKRQKRDRSGTN